MKISSRSLRKIGFCLDKIQRKYIFQIQDNLYIQVVRSLQKKEGEAPVVMWRCETVEVTCIADIIRVALMKMYSSGENNVRLKMKELLGTT